MITNIYKQWYDISPRLQKHSRNTLGAKIESLLIETIELLFRANFTARVQKIELLQEADWKCNILKHLLQISWELKMLNHKQYALLSAPLIEAGKTLGGLLKSYH